MQKLFILIKSNLFRLFRRKITSLAFIPEIDGLRFLAIILVIISHIQGLYLSRGNDQVPASGWQNYFWQLLNSGNLGVLLFFAISGFVLVLPFARYHLLSKDKVSLKKYYIRRLTRLEPPYLLVMLFLFVMKLILQKQNFIELFPHLGATLLYSHLAIYNEVSRITPITWSLEIEIQFYLLAPFLASIFRLPKLPRRLILAVLLFIFPFLQRLFGLPHFTLFGMMQYFLVGFILVDLYLCQDKVSIGKRIIKPLGAILFLLIILVRPDQPWRTYLYPLLMLAFYYMVLNAIFWKKIFQNKLLTSIGGMCYSLYLLHFAIISFVGTKSFSLKLTNSYFLNILLQICIHLPIIILISSVYYLLIEKPCMDPNWPQRIKEFARRIKIKLVFFSHKKKESLNGV